MSAVGLARQVQGFPPHKEALPGEPGRRLYSCLSVKYKQERPDLESGITLPLFYCKKILYNPQKENGMI